MIYFIFHGNCFDGFIAAYSAWLKHRDNPNIRFISANYNEPFPVSDSDLVGAEVYVMDFSYPKDVLLHVESLVKSIKVLDHHKTAKDQLSSLSFATFDMTKSGAMLAWEYFHPNKSAPKLVQYVQDRDLWKWLLPNSRAVNAVVQSYNIGKIEDFKTFELLCARLEQKKELPLIIKEGDAILRSVDQITNIAIKRGFKWIEIQGHMVPAVNTSVFESEICAKLLALYPQAEFSATYYDFGTEGYQAFSLRSLPGSSFDVSSIALIYGGGGHPNAAGFKKKKE
jgi:oligoribonuclease NrnB/cAMP/cGMP phosphodiesterase (DHH superfamily)